ncbi:MAG: ABC transporter permease [Acidobacteriota bacterium]
MGTLLQDLRYGARMLLRKPGFTFAAVLTVALAIGANTAIFSLVDALLLRPLQGVDDPARLAIVYTSDFSSGLYSNSSYPDYVDLRDQNQVFSELAAFADDQPIHLSTGAEAERIRGAAVTGNYFAALGVKTALGRPLLPEDDSMAAAVISYDLWRNRFNSESAVIGRTVQLNGRTFSIVGVAAEGFKGTGLRTVLSVWVPLTVYAETGSSAASSSPLLRRGSRGYFLVGRLKPRVPPEQAQANVTDIAAQLARTYPQTNMGTLSQPDQPRPVTIVSLDRAMVGPDARDATKRLGLMLMAVVGLVLLIACANVANLLLARASGRQREIAVRLALGATRFRIVRQMLTESMLLSLAGGGLGLLLALWLADELISLEAFAVFAGLNPALDWRVLGFTLLVSLLTGALFGLAPALQASKPDLAPVLKNTALAGGGISRRFGLRSALVVFQIALSLVLLIGAGLFLRSLQQAYATDLGFGTSEGFLASVDMARQGYSEAQGRNFYEQLAERVEAMPGVRAVTLAQYIPVNAGGSRTTIYIDGYSRQPGEDLELNLNIVDAKYFNALGIPLLAGRGFSEQDTKSTAKVIIINEAMSRRFWLQESSRSSQEAVGKRLSLSGPQGPFYEVIGVAKTGKYRNLREDPLPYMYLPLSQEYRSRLTLFVRTAGDPALLMPALRGEVQRVDRTVALFDVKTLDEHLGRALGQERTNAWLIGSFGLLALVLAAVGIYGVMSYTVTQRTREVGIRLALGARPRDVLQLVVGQGMMLTAAGLVIGLVAAFALTGVISSLLYGVSATDPATFLAVAIILAGVALMACYLPARRAAKVDPMAALRYE